MSTALLDDPTLDRDRCYRAVASRDARFDGWFIVGVTSTGIYCRPSCPAPVRPKAVNTRFFPTAAAAQAAGFRACKRCLPDATPGSPAWDVRGDLAARAMRAIADGVVDRDGVPGLAHALAVSERHLGRVLTERLGAGPLALARARRAQSARVLIETTDLAFTDVAFAAGFASIRQFNDTVRDVFATTPTELRRRRTSARGVGRRPSNGVAAISLRLAHRAPLDWDGLHAWFAARAVARVEDHHDGIIDRTLRLPGGVGLVEVRPGGPDHVLATLHLADVADLGVAAQRCRRLLDLDSDPASISEVLGRQVPLARALAAAPGIRCPASASPEEGLARAVVGQQISVPAAATVLGRLAATVGATAADVGRPDRLLFPTASEIAALGDDDLPMPRARAATLRRACAALVEGTVDLGPASDRVQARRALLGLRGIGPWTAGYVAMRALHDPDVLLVDDLGVRQGARALGLPDAPAALATAGAAWGPWRSYASHLLWHAAGTERLTSDQPPQHTKDPQ